MPFGANTAICVWNVGSDAPPILGASEYDYVMTKRPADILLKNGEYPSKVYAALPDWAKESGTLQLIYAVGYEDEVPIAGSHEYGFEVDGETYWCSMVNGVGAAPSSDLWPLAVGLGLGAIGGLAIAVFAPGKPLSKGGTIASTSLAGFAGLLGGMVYNAYKGSA